MSAIIIRGGRIIDPANKRDEIADLYIVDGKIVGSKSEIREEFTRRGGQTSGATKVVPIESAFVVK